MQRQSCSSGIQAIVHRKLTDVRRFEEAWEGVPVPRWGRCDDLPSLGNWRNRRDPFLPATDQPSHGATRLYSPNRPAQIAPVPGVPANRHQVFRDLCSKDATGATPSTANAFDYLMTWSAPLIGPRQPQPTIT
jgi:hypothetical protein